MPAAWRGDGDWGYVRVATRAIRPVITLTAMNLGGITAMAKAPQSQREWQNCDRVAAAAVRPVIGMIPLLMVQAYRTRRPEFGPLGACHLEPTCSTYAEQVLQEHRNLKAGLLIAKRIYRCRRTHA